MADTSGKLIQKKPKITDIYQPNGEVKEVIRFVYDRKRQMEDSEDRNKAQKKWTEGEKQWEALREIRGVDEWQSNHYVPMTLSIVETALSEIIRQNLRPFILPRGLEDETKAKVMQHIWDYAWEVSNGDMTLYDTTKELLIKGTAVIQEYYRVDKRKIGSVSPGKDGKEETNYKEVVDYDDVCTELVRLEDFYVDEYARGFDGPYAARDCIRRYIMDIEDFHRMYDKSVWDQFEDAKLVKAGGDTDYYEVFKPPQGMDSSKQVEVLHYWNKPKDKFIIVANDILIRNNPNPYKHKQLPFARAVDLKRVHRFYGKGEPELLESIQDEINTLRRMIIDRNHLDIDKMFLVSNKMGLTDEDLIARPHGMIPTDDPQGAKAIEYGDIPRSVELSLKHLEDDSTISTGINPRAQALPTAGTATEAAILKESTLRRIEIKIWLLKKDFLIRLGRLRLSNILQFYPQPKLEKIVGEKNSEDYKAQVDKLKTSGSFAQIGGEDYSSSFRQIRIPGQRLDVGVKGELSQTPIQGYSFFELRPKYFMPFSRGGYDLSFQAGSNIEISKPLMQSKILELYDRFAQLSLQVPGSYDPVKLGDMVLKEYFDKNPDEFKPDAIEGQVPEDQQRIEMQIQLAAMENQMLMKEIAVPATAGAAPLHTRVHLEFMDSEAFQQLPNDSPILQNMVTHVTGELIGQGIRGSVGVGAVPTPPIQTAAPAPASSKKGATRMGQGVENKRGGMKKPANKISDIMPSLNTGGNRNLP